MPHLARRQVVLALLVGVLTLAIGVYGLLIGPGASTSSQGQRSPARGTPDTAAAVGAASRDPGATRLPRTTDPVVYARAVAVALFDWDTASGYLPADYESRVLTDADPSGEETPGLIEDVASYLPTSEQWLNLATMEVAQSLTITSAVVPGDWPSISASAHGQLRTGTVAVTITGTRERTGVWDGEYARTASPVAFTVFLACAPAFDRCHVLRLSELDNPLR